MKKILGLDLGTNSIGWALVDSKGQKILGMGSRIIPRFLHPDLSDVKDRLLKANHNLIFAQPLLLVITLNFVSCSPCWRRMNLSNN